MLHLKAPRKNLEHIRNEVQDMVSRLDVADTTRAIFLSGPYSQIEKMMVGLWRSGRLLAGNQSV